MAVGLVWRERGSRRRCRPSRSIARSPWCSAGSPRRRHCSFFLPDLSPRSACSVAPRHRRMRPSRRRCRRLPCHGRPVSLCCRRGLRMRHWHCPQAMPIRAALRHLSQRRRPWVLDPRSRPCRVRRHPSPKLSSRRPHRRAQLYRAPCRRAPQPRRNRLDQHRRQHLSRARQAEPRHPLNSKHLRPHPRDRPLHPHRQRG